MAKTKIRAKANAKLKSKATTPIGPLRGWKQIAEFLGLPISTAERWVRSGLPVRRRGRRIEADPEEINRWMARETHEPVRIATESTDLSSELRRGLSYVRSAKKKPAA